MNIQQLYEKYDVMPQLVEHQLRVGGIIKLITDDKDSILTGLVHDMGNLVKFGSLDPVWESKQKLFRSKYGNDAHEATINILNDAGLTRLKKCIEEENDFYETIIEKDDYGDTSESAILTLYADSRVSINGVTSMMERIIDLETRYNTKRNDRVWAPKLEKHVQDMAEIDVTKITESDVRPLFDELLSYNV